jgi:hypothetical protein
MAKNAKNEWKRKEEVVSQIFNKSEFSGTFIKHVYVKEDEAVVVEKEEELYEVLEPGERTVTSIMDSGFNFALFVDISVKNINGEIRRIDTGDGKKFDMKAGLSFRISDPVMYMDTIVDSRKFVYISDIWDELYMELLIEAILPKTREKGVGEISRDKELMKSVEKAMESKSRGILSSMGIDFVSLSVKWEFPEEPPAHGKKEVVELPSECGPGKRETEKQGEVEKAEEAEVKETKQKTHEEKGDPAKEIEEKIEELNKAKEIAEKKFFKNELSEEVFRKLAESYEKRIIELEGKLELEREKKKPQ